MKKKLLKLIATIAFATLAFGNIVVINNSGSREINLNKFGETNVAQATSGIWYFYFVTVNFQYCNSGGQWCCPFWDCPSTPQPE
jgi:hypothetical protein